MPKVVHFEIGVDNPKRAIKFYEKAFGWKVHKWDGPMDYWLIQAGDEDEPGIDGAFSAREPNSIITNTIGVDDVDKSIEKILSAGGEIIYEKQAIPGVGYLAYFKDTEGNIYGIMSDDPDAI